MEQLGQCSRAGGRPTASVCVCGGGRVLKLAQWDRKRGRGDVVRLGTCLHAPPMREVLLLPLSHLSSVLLGGLCTHLLDQAPWVS